jgi:hypothetical protein
MTDAETTSAMRQSQRKPPPQRDPNHPLSRRPMAQERNDAVAQLAGALRTAKRARRAYLAKLREGDYLAELRQGDVEPAEDWSTWYAEYLLGLH